MPTRRSSLRLLALMAAGWLSFGALAEIRFYDQDAFAKAVAAGGPVVVQFHADWCPTCRAQGPVIDQVLAEPKMKTVQFFRADYDKEKKLKSVLHIREQSTFVVFRNGKEVARSTGQTEPAAIDALFSKAL